MTTRKSAQRPNAFKHGGFSKIALFPWENEDEYQSLHLELREEWNSSGALEEDAVFTILTCMWRKRRIRDRRRFEILAALKTPQFKSLTEQPTPFFETRMEAFKYNMDKNRGRSNTRSLDDAANLLGFSSRLYGTLTPSIVQLSIKMLGKKFSAHLNEKILIENYQNSSEWVRAIKREVDDVLLPAARETSTENDEALAEQLFAQAAEFMSPDRIMEDLALEERFQTMIERAIRMLAQLKMMKQISGVNTKEETKYLPIQIAGPKQDAKLE